MPAEIGEGVGDVGELVGMFEIDREEPVVPGGAADRFDVAGESRGPYRHAGELNRSGKEGDAVDGVVPAVVVHRLAGPRGGEDLQ